MYRFSTYKRQYKANLKLALPVVMTQLGQILVQVADNVMVGRYGGDDPTPLAATSFGGSVFFILFIAEEEKAKFDFVVSRAVMPLDDLVKLVKKNIASQAKNAMPNGLICLKGGELHHEILPYKNIADTYEISDYFREEFFKTKKVVYVPM
jgi:hypothetical protein